LAIWPEKTKVAYIIPDKEAIVEVPLLLVEYKANTALSRHDTGLTTRYLNGRTVPKCSRSQDQEADRKKYRRLRSSG
jgi:hypothetical protein